MCHTQHTHTFYIIVIYISRARSLIAEAGFKVGMSDGGLVTEAKPPVKWNKGNAAIYILKTAFGVHWSDNIRVIYAGDDLTDEDAMKSLKVCIYQFDLPTVEGVNDNDFCSYFNTQ